MIKQLKNLNRYTPQALLCQKRVYNYNSLLGRPVDSLAINSIINFDIECIKLFHYDMMIPWSGSILIASIGLRLSFELSKYIINKFPIKSKEDRSITKIINEVFLKDLSKDIEFYKLQQIDSDRMKQFYSLNNLVSYGVNSYLFLSFYRCLNHITQHCHQFDGFAQEGLLWMSSIQSYDPYFILPLSTIILNYYLLKNSQHPSLIHLRNDPNSLKPFNLAFFSSLFAIFLPANYIIGYIGFISSHIIIRSINQRQQQKQALDVLKKYQLTNDFIKKY